jgi:hypothetical protein
VPSDKKFEMVTLFRTAPSPARKSSASSASVQEIAVVLMVAVREVAFACKIRNWLK